MSRCIAAPLTAALQQAMGSAPQRRAPAAPARLACRRGPQRQVVHGTCYSRPTAARRKCRLHSTASGSSNSSSGGDPPPPPAAPAEAAPAAVEGAGAAALPPASASASAARSLTVALVSVDEAVMALEAADAQQAAPAAAAEGWQPEPPVARERQERGGSGAEQQLQHPPPQRRGPVYLGVSILAVVAFAVANRVLYKMAVTPLANYIFFLAQAQTFGYILVYRVLLGLRISAGKVTPQMMELPRREWRMFLAIGLVEALSAFCHFIGASGLPGVVLPLLSQTVLFWQVLLGYLLLGKTLAAPQLLGCAAVMGGVCLASWPGASGGIASPLQGVSPFFALLFVVSNLFPALDTILKERIFVRARGLLGQDLDLFVVNTFGSLSQAFFVALLLPLITGLRGMPLAQLPGYLVQGWECFRGITPACGSNCSGAPLMPLLYVAANLGFNVAVLNLIRAAGNVTISIVMSATVPLTIYAFTVPLPYLEAPPPLSHNFIRGAATLLLGLLLYNFPVWWPAAARAARAWAGAGEERPSAAPRGGAAAGAA